MESGSSRSGYHEPVSGFAGPEVLEDDWGDDFPKTFSVNLIWAQAHDKEGRSGAIGYQGAMPWHLSEDLRRFKELTVSHPVIMGRKTWEALDERFRPLPNRDNIVVSRDRDFHAPGATVVDNLEEALDMARQEAIPDDGLDRSEIWVIGGSQLFNQLLPLASKIFMTQIDAKVDADAYAPDLSAAVEDGSWKLVENSGWQKPKKADGIKRFRYLTFERNRENGNNEEE